MSLRVEPCEIDREGNLIIPGHTAQDTQDFRSLRYLVAPEIAKRLGGPIPRETNLTPEELQVFSECENYAQFRATCDAIKLRRGYDYPPDWWATMMSTGLHNAIMERISNPSNPDFKEQVRRLAFPILFPKDPP